VLKEVVVLKDFMALVMEKAKSDPKRIVFPESEEERVLRALELVKKEGFAKPILIGKQERVLKRIEELGLDIPDLDVVDPESFDRFDEYAEKLFELRQHKGVGLDKAKEILKDYCYFGTMMIYMGDADGLISGSTHSTGKTVLPALQIIKTKEKFHKVSGLFLMIYHDRVLLFADCAITINPDAKDLAEIALDSAQTARKFGIEPRVAMLSFSSKGSAKHPMVDKVREATQLVRNKDSSLIIDGELQVDAAIVPDVAKIKCPDCKIQGDANVLVFPDLNSGNMAYKLVERLAKFKAVGPILQGLRKPVNDLSRGCSVQDIVEVTAITVVEAQE